MNKQFLPSMLLGVFLSFTPVILFSESYSKAEIDLMMQLQQKESEAKESKAKIEKEYARDITSRQDRTIDATHNYVLNQTGMYGWWMTFISIGTAILIAAIGMFVNSKIRRASGKLDNGLEEFKKKVEEDLNEMHYRSKRTEEKMESVMSLCDQIIRNIGDKDDNHK